VIQNKPNKLPHTSTRHDDNHTTAHWQLQLCISIPMWKTYLALIVKMRSIAAAAAAANNV
jgi:hypothetical protein